MTSRTDSEYLPVTVSFNVSVDVYLSNAGKYVDVKKCKYKWTEHYA